MSRSLNWLEASIYPISTFLSFTASIWHVLTTCPLSCAVNSWFSSRRVFSRSALITSRISESGKGYLPQTKTLILHNFFLYSFPSKRFTFPKSVFDLFLIFLLRAGSLVVIPIGPFMLFAWKIHSISSSLDDLLNASHVRWLSTSSLKKYLSTLLILIFRVSVWRALCCHPLF